MTVTGCATRLPEDEFARSRERLEHYLMNDAMPQSEINILSQNMVELANTERYWLEYRIWNQSNYDQIEKSFTADCEAWEKQADAEAKKPSQYKGGSLEPTDHNLRMTGFIEKRIEELRTKWRQK